MDNPTRTQDLFQRIRAAIFEGEFEPGAHLSEYALAERFETSRTPVRNALAGLAAQDLVTYRENRGYVVREMTRADVLSRLRVRAAMEGLAARLVAIRPLADAERATLRGALSECQETTRNGVLAPADCDRYIGAVNVFHAVLRRGAGVELLTETIQRSMYFPFRGRERIVWVEHEEFVVRNGFARGVNSGTVDRARIIDAIQEGNGARAETLTREHMFTVSLGLEALLPPGLDGPAPVARHRGD